LFPLCSCAQVESGNPSSLKKAFMRAARALHPDKLQAGSVAASGSTVTLEEAVAAEVLFTTLGALYEAFKAAH